MEHELKRPLFVRLPRGVSATSLGHQLASEIRSPLGALDAVVASFRPDAELTKARLILGGPVDFISHGVLPLLLPLAGQGLTVEIRTGLTADLLKSLGVGELDLVIATTPTRVRGVTMTPLFDEVLALTMSRQLAASIGIGSTSSHRIPDLLAESPLIAFAANAPLVRRYWRTVFGLSSAPKARIVIDDLRAIASAVAAYGAWSVLPTYLTNAAVRTGDLVIPFVPPQPPSNTLYLATLTSSTPRPSLDRVIDHLVSALR